MGRVWLRGAGSAREGAEGWGKRLSGAGASHECPGAAGRVHCSAADARTAAAAATARRRRCCCCCSCRCGCRRAAACHRPGTAASQAPLHLLAPQRPRPPHTSWGSHPWSGSRRQSRPPAGWPRWPPAGGAVHKGQVRRGPRGRAARRPRRGARRAAALRAAVRGLQQSTRASASSARPYRGPHQAECRTHAAVSPRFVRKRFLPRSGA